MSCSLAAFAACFTMSGFYVDGGVAIQDRGLDTLTTTTYHIEQEPCRPNRFCNSPIPDVVSQEITRDKRNPYGLLSLGYEVDFSPRWSARIEAAHMSSLATGRDRGVESIALHVRWHPFGD